MKKSLYFLLIFFFCTLLLKSQHLSPVWVHHIGGASYDGFGENFFQIDNNNDIVITGLLTDAQIGSFSVNGPFVAKYSENGNLLWLSLPDTVNRFIELGT